MYVRMCLRACARVHMFLFVLVHLNPTPSLSVSFPIGFSLSLSLCICVAVTVHAVGSVKTSGAHFWSTRTPCKPFTYKVGFSMSLFALSRLTHE